MTTLLIELSGSNMPCRSSLATSANAAPWISIVGGILNLHTPGTATSCQSCVAPRALAPADVSRGGFRGDAGDGAVMSPIKATMTTVRVRTAAPAMNTQGFGAVPYPVIAFQAAVIAPKSMSIGI